MSATDKTEIGDQFVIPGGERITTRALLERRFNQPDRGKVPQRNPGGMFAAPEPEQIDLLGGRK